MKIESISKEVLVTVVTVSYNSSAYVRDAIESVLAQSYVNFEYIIADDCSTDTTWDIIQEYRDPRIKSYQNETNLREYPNRNKAVKRATGKYLIFIDGDDVIYPHGLEFMVRMLEAFPLSAMAIMRPFHRKLIYPIELTPRDLFVAEYFDKSFLDTALTNTLFKTDVLNKIELGTTGYASEDTFLRLQIAKQNKCLLINDNLTWWRITPGQATSKITSSIKGAVQHFDFKSKLLNEDCPLTNEEQKLALRNMQRKVAHRALRMLLKLQVGYGIQLLKKTGLFLKFIPALFFEITHLDPFEKYSEVKPWKLDFDSHPFANPKSFSGGSK